MDSHVCDDDSYYHHDDDNHHGDGDDDHDDDSDGISEAKVSITSSYHAVVMDG